MAINIIYHILCWLPVHRIRHTVFLGKNTIGGRMWDMCRWVNLLGFPVFRWMYKLRSSVSRMGTTTLLPSFVKKKNEEGVYMEMLCIERASGREGPPVISRQKWMCFIFLSRCQRRKQLTCGRDLSDRPHPYARADETHHSFDCQFYPKVQNRFLSVNSCSPREPIDRTWVRERKAFR